MVPVPMALCYRLLGDMMKKQIIIVDGNIAALKDMRDTLEATYDVATFRTALEAKRYISNHAPDLAIVGKDMLEFDAKEVRDVLNNDFRAKQIRSFVMERPLFTEELIGKVTEALSEE